MNARLKPRHYVITLGSYWLTHVTPHSFQTLRHTIWLSYFDWLKITIESDLWMGRTSLHCFTHFMLDSIVYSLFSAVLPRSTCDILMNAFTLLYVKIELVINVLNVLKVKLSYTYCGCLELLSLFSNYVWPATKLFFII